MSDVETVVARLSDAELAQLREQSADLKQRASQIDARVKDELNRRAQERSPYKAGDVVEIEKRRFGHREVETRTEKWLVLSVRHDFLFGVTHRCRRVLVTGFLGARVSDINLQVEKVQRVVGRQDPQTGIIIME